jgi:hypothetical protein
MTRLIARGLSLSVLALPLALVACTSDPPELLDESVGAIAVSGGGVTVDVLPTFSFHDGFTGAVRIIDTGFESPISTFEVVFNLGSAVGVGTAFNGNITDTDNFFDHTATNPSWLSFVPIQVGQTWEVGFNGSGTFTESTILSVKLNGTAIPIGTGGGQ